MTNNEIFNLQASSSGCFGAGYSYEIFKWNWLSYSLKIFQCFF